MVNASSTLLDKFQDDVVNRALKDSRSYKSRSRVVYMLPDSFLKLALPLQSYQVNEYSVDTLTDVLQQGGKISDLPYLTLQQVTTNVFIVTGHEGRHRSMALKALYPNKLMPVVIRDLTVRWNEDGYSEGDKILLVSESRRHRIQQTL